MIAFARTCVIFLIMFPFLSARLLESGTGKCHRGMTVSTGDVSLLCWSRCSSPLFWRTYDLVSGTCPRAVRASRSSRARVKPFSEVFGLGARFGGRRLSSIRRGAG